MNETAYDRIMAALRDRGCRVVERGGQRAEATCPHHDDHNPSVSVTGIESRVLVWCHGGCDTRDVLTAAGLTLADLYDQRSAEYRYDDGRTVRRYYDERGKKRFAQNGAGQTSTLYHLAQLSIAGPGTVFLVEGESDVHAVESAGGVATTAPQGSRSFHKVDVGPLTGRHVTAVVDRDDAGDEWAAQVRRAVAGVAAGLRFVRAAEGKDASDHIAAGHGLTDFEAYELPIDYVEARDDASRILDIPAVRENREDDTPEPASKVILTQASAFAMKGTGWLYKGRVPVGMVTLLAGREGIGKSTVSLDIAARLTRGTLDGRYLGKPQSVIVCATEDSWEHTIVPRLRSVDADMDLIFHIAVQDEEGNVRSIIAPSDSHRMEMAFRNVRPALMLIDPLMAVIDGRIDTHKQAEVQQALEPMVKMCDRLGMSILAVIHVNKTNSTDPLTNIMGSKAFATLPRSILYCIEEADGSFMFCHVKCNVGPKMPSVGYRLAPVRFDLDPTGVEEGDDYYIESSRVIWGDEDIRTAADILQEAASSSPAVGAARAEILALIDSADGVVTTPVIREKLSHLTARQIDNALSRMAAQNQVRRLSKGVYLSRHHSV